MNKLQRIAAGLIAVGMVGQVASMLHIYSTVGRCAPEHPTCADAFFARWVLVNHLSLGVFALGVLLILGGVIVPKLRRHRP